jgi:ankyrin repeat protein
MIKMLLVAGSDISARDQAGNTPFVIAFSAVKAPLGVLQTLLGAGADINAPGLLALHQTIRSSWKEDYLNFQYSDRRLQLFIDSKADVNEVDKDGLSPLHLAVASFRTNMVQILITAGANVSAKAPKLGWTPLHYLAAYPNSWCNFPIAGWPNSNISYARSIIEDPDGSAPTYTRRIILTLLLKAGAGVSIKLSSGEMPLHLAVQHGCVETVKALLDAGAGATARDQNGNTPLHIAFQYRGPTLASFAKVLLDAGSDISAQNSQGYTPLHLGTMGPDLKS